MSNASWITCTKSGHGIFTTALHGLGTLPLLRESRSSSGFPMLDETRGQVLPAVRTWRLIYDNGHLIAKGGQSKAGWAHQSPPKGPLSEP